MNLRPSTIYKSTHKIDENCHFQVVQQSRGHRSVKTYDVKAFESHVKNLKYMQLYSSEYRISPNSKLRISPRFFKNFTKTGEEDVSSIHETNDSLYTHLLNAFIS